MLIVVYVLNPFGQPLMPTDDHRKVRILLKEKKATVVRRSPFTIRLLHRTKQYVQPVTLGVDAGSKHVGVSACTPEKELFRAELMPRNDVVDLMSTRRELRRSRRNRTTRYRAPRFENRVHSKRKGWLAPSVEVKIHNHNQLIEFACKILPVSLIRIETAEFDLQRLKAMEKGKPLPEGEDYQHGEMYDQYNVRQYVLFRDNYTCQCCGAHPTDKKPVKLHVHHKESRKVGGNAPNNLITLCEDCHDLLHKGIVELPDDKKRRGKSSRDATFMGIMRKTLLQRLRDKTGIPIQNTYGYITKAIRESNGIEKTHTSDARCIARCPKAKPAAEEYLIKPVRRHNRRLHKNAILKGGYRKANQAPTFVFGFKLFDMVDYNGEECFVYGRRSSGSFDVRHLDGKKVSAGVSYKRLRLLEHPNNLLFERMGGSSHD